MSDLEKFAAQMRDDWNRRVSHDYRFWMSDGHKDDQTMWQAGSRDFEILLDGISTPETKSFLELGCGVGRLLKSALQRFGSVTGVDVSDKAIAKAGELLGADARLSLIVGNGFDLHQIATGSVDVAVSFAALTSMPTQVIANYLRELHRVVRRGGTLRLQVYLGEEQVVASNDTLHLRCYDRRRFEEAVTTSGFDIEWVRELVLPFQVSAKELGIEALIISLTRAEREPVSAEKIATSLLPAGEPQHAMTGVSDLECWMALNYAKDLVASGDAEKGRDALEYAASFAKSVTIDISDTLHQIVTDLERLSAKKENGSAPTIAVNAPSAGEVWQQNLTVLSTRFPKVAAAILAFEGPPVVVKSSAQGPVLWERDTCLDHPEKPVAAAETFVKRTLAERRFTNCRQIVCFGFGGGYHLESIASHWPHQLAVVEPSLAAFKVALQERDLRSILSHIAALSVGMVEDGSSEFDDTTELLLRPQTQALWADEAATLKSKVMGKRGFGALHPTIAVLGPLMGGTLPITTYCSRALAMMGQRLRHFDVSGFAAPTALFETFVKDNLRQKVLWTNYTEMVSQVVLEAVTEKPIDILICMAQAPISPRVLGELRKRGIVTVLWFQEDYLRFTYWQEMARWYDFVFTIQDGECVSLMRNAGAGEAHYLPMACDPQLHTPMQLTAEERERWGSPISFVGAGYHNRQQTFASFAELPFKIWGTEWPFNRPFDKLVQEEGRRLKPEEYIKIFNSTDININLHSSNERDGVDPYGDFVNPRTFELAACGAFQLVDERRLLPALFEAGKEVATFSTPAELRERIEYYRVNPEERRRIAEAGRKRALNDHTYDKRMRQMLTVIYSSKFEHLKTRQDASPWSKMLERSRSNSELHTRLEKAYQRGEEPNLDGVVSDIITGSGKLSDTEKKLLLLYHVRKQIRRMTAEENGGKG